MIVNRAALENEDSSHEIIAVKVPNISVVYSAETMERDEPQTGTLQEVYCCRNVTNYGRMRSMRVKSRLAVQIY